MANREEHISLPEEVDNFLEVTRRVNILIDELVRSVTIAEGIHQGEAIRQIALMRNAMEEVEHRFERATKAILKRIRK